VTRTNALGAANVIFITYDSCRWDTWQAADTSQVEKYEPALRAWSQATFTYPSHLAALQGILPHSTCWIPFYNRYCRQLVRIARISASTSALVTLPESVLDLPSGFSNAGYRTFVSGAVRWFRHPDLSRSFDRVLFTGIHASRQVAEFLDWQAQSDQPFFALINFGETHYPYQYESLIEPPNQSPARAHVQGESLDLRALHEQQIECCSYLDGQVGHILATLARQSRATVVVVMADHGDCFGEDGLVGHGFFHEKVMEVPMVVCAVGGDGSGLAQLAG